MCETVDSDEREIHHCASPEVETAAEAGDEHKATSMTVFHKLEH